MRRILVLTFAVTLLASWAAAPASAGTRGPAPSAGILDFSGPTVPMRDVVRDYATASSSRKLARAGVTRYPVGDSEGRTVGISVTPLCSSNFLLCNGADPQTIATFLGTLVHGDEITSLNVQVTTDQEITVECAPGAQACYFPSQERMVISGNDTTGTDGATREFVLAHEYGHHVANTRRNPPFSPTIAWGTKRWGTYERVCQGATDGTYEPGAETPDSSYRRNPGEAFAESFAFNRFRDAPVQWGWIDSLKPDAGAYAAINADTLRPWAATTKTVFARRFGRRGRASITRRVKTPLDGTFALKLTGPRRADFDLLIRDSAGKIVDRSQRRGTTESLRGTVCGTKAFTAIVRRIGHVGGRFRLAIFRP